LLSGRCQPRPVVERLSNGRQALPDQDDGRQLFAAMGVRGIFHRRIRTVAKRRFIRRRRDNPAAAGFKADLGAHHVAQRRQ
jgi:hypothetical protein